MTLQAEQVAEIRASEGCYRAADVARAYDIHRSTVTRIWAGIVHEEIPAAYEPPNIQTKVRPRDVAEDIHTLLNRGMNPEQVAKTLGISKASVYRARGVFL